MKVGIVHPAISQVGKSPAAVSGSGNQLARGLPARPAFHVPQGQKTSAFFFLAAFLEYHDRRRH